MMISRLFSLFVLLGSLVLIYSLYLVYLVPQLSHVQLYTPVRCILLLMNVDSHLHLLNLCDLSRSDEHSILGQEIIVIRLTLAYMQRKFRNKLDFMDQAEQCEIFYLN